MLAELREQLLRHIHNPQQQPLSHLGLFQTHQLQALRQVPIHQPTLILVIAGCKTLLAPGQHMTASGGQMLLVKAGEAVNLTNDPCAEQGLYLALTIGFSDQVIRHYQDLQHSQQTTPKPETVRPISLIQERAKPQNPAKQNGQQNDPKKTAQYNTALAMSAELIRCAQQWVALCQKPDSPTVLHTLKAVELLVHLEQSVPSEHTLTLNEFLGSAKASWKTKTLDLLQSDLARGWQISDVCQRLATSESSLRRHLQSEGTSFRELLEDSRLLAALGMLQESYRPIGHIALDVGYSNQGHFTERFKKRFAMSPSELRQTREPVAM